MEHTHKEDENGKGDYASHGRDGHNHEEGNEGHDHDHGDASAFETYIPAIVSFLMLFIGIAFDNWINNFFFNTYLRLPWYVLSYLPVGLPVLKEVYETIIKGEVFTEFLLMSLATIGAFGIGEYPEGVAVMLFYTIGELFQGAAVSRATRNIKSLLDVRPDIAFVYRNGKYENINPDSVLVGETIQIKAGEKVPLDAEMVSDSSSFNTSALTGESKPKTIRKGETVLAGMLNLDKVIELTVTRIFKDSSLARILDMVQNATSRKAKTELFIRRFAAVYTPIIFFLALALVLLPFLFVPDYYFKVWLYRALVFLVVSCPCALVISIPLGYFGGIGAASANGILYKGSNFLDIITKVDTVVMDKTGTLTHGVFKVQKVETLLDRNEFLSFLVAVEAKSSHPIAKAIVTYCIEKKTG